MAPDAKGGQRRAQPEITTRNVSASDSGLDTSSNVPSPAGCGALRDTSAVIGPDVYASLAAGIAPERSDWHKNLE